MVLAERYRFYMMWALLGLTTLDSKWKYYSWADFNRARVLLIELIEGDCDE